MEYSLLKESLKSARINNDGDEYVIIFYILDGELEKGSQNLCYESSF